jgi:RNA polymerase sigma-70 factor (ECF subfamily)
LELTIVKRVTAFEAIRVNTGHLRRQSLCDLPAYCCSLVVVHDRTDGQLVAEVLAGRVDTYGVLVRRYQDAYVRFAVRMLGNRDDADDALQSAFLRAYRKLDECQEPNRFGAWLYQIVSNECRTFASRRASRERRMVRDETELDRAGDDPNERSGELEDIQRALDRLEPDQKEAFILKHVEELSYDEMADLTGVSVSALKMRVKRGCERLRQLLDNSRSLS